jgi:proline- and glutamine-rich splicing factor
LPELLNEEVRFSGRNRLYVGNLTSDITEDELKDMFSPYGEIAEAFINTEKNFAFLKIDYRANAERAKKELDGTMRKNRPLRIRFAPNATTIRVKNLTPFVSNELLYKAFEVFGLIERAVIIVDDRGKPTGEGIVEYARKSGAMGALKFCSEKCFFLTSCLRPCVVEPFEHIDETDGCPEKSLMKKSNEYYKARQNGPRFAELGSFEDAFGTKWKQLYDLYKQKHDALKREMQIEEEKLEAQMEYARFEHETESLREQLRKREQDRDRQKKEWEDKERQAEEFKMRDEQQMRRQQDDMQLRMQRQDDEMRRRQQENSLFMQAQQLSNMLDQQEMGHQGGNQGGSNQGGGGRNKNFDNDNRRNFDNQGKFDFIHSQSKIISYIFIKVAETRVNTSKIIISTTITIKEIRYGLC